MKASNGWSDKDFNELLQFLNDLLPKVNMLPRSTYQAKKNVCLLGLEVEKIHAYQNDCMLFCNEVPYWRNVVFAEHHDTSEMIKISMKMTWERIKKLIHNLCYILIFFLLFR
jgi:hypothetical protein